MESEEFQGNGVPRAGVVIAGEERDVNAGEERDVNAGEEIDVHPERIIYIFTEIRDPDLKAIVREFAYPYIAFWYEGTTAAEGDTILMHFEALMIRVFSEAKKDIAKGKCPKNSKLLVQGNFEMYFDLGTDCSRAKYRIAKGSTEKLDKDYFALAKCASEVLQEIEDRMIDLFSSVKETIERAKAAAFEETVAAAAPKEEMPEKFRDLIRTIAINVRFENSFDRAHVALTLFVAVILRLTMAPIVEIWQNMQLLPTDAGEGSSEEVSDLSD